MLNIYWGLSEVDLQHQKKPGFDKLNGICKTVNTGKMCCQKKLHQLNYRLTFNKKLVLATCTQ